MWRLHLRRGSALISTGLAGSWALGLLIIVGQASEQVAGPYAVVALVMSAVTALLTALCRSLLDATPPCHAWRRRRCLMEDLPAFLTLWLSLLANLTALAACSRALSATMDYIAGWRHQLWIQNKMGPLPSILGGNVPDVMALVVTIVLSLLFVMGLEHSTVLRLILNVSLFTTVIFFTAVGSMQADASNWTEHTGWSGVLTAAALYSFGFLGFVGLSSQVQGRRWKLVATGTTLTIMLLSYCAFAVILSLMYQFQALAGFPVPLLRAFEIRDVDWARLVMAVFSIVGLALTLLEVCTPLHAIVVCLGGEDWRVLPRAIAKEFPSTNTPVLAILVAGVPASIIACVCPLWLLVQVMCTGPLIDHAITAATLIHRRYQPRGSGKLAAVSGKGPHVDECEEEDTDAEGLKQHKITVRCLKSGLGFLPAVIRGPEQQFYTSLSSPVARSISSESVNVTYIDPDNISLVQENLAKNEMNRSGSTGTIVTSVSYDSMTQGQMDTRCMTNGSVTSLESMIMDQSDAKLFGHPMPVAGDRRYSNEETALCREVDEDDPTLSSASSSSSEDSDSSHTDIDAIVAEYKERIKVATTLTGVQPVVHEPTAATGRRVTLCIAGMLASICLIGTGTVLPRPVNMWFVGVGLIGLALMLVVVSRQPQNRPCTLLVPWFPAMMVLINTLLCSQLMATVWPVVTLWIIAGFVLYWRKRGWWRCRYRPVFSSSRRERIRLHAPPRHHTVSTLIPSHRCLPDDRVRRLTQVDTILISR